MRLDKFLCDMNIGSRSQVKQYLQKGGVTVNGAVCKDAKLHINEKKDEICYQGKHLVYQQYYYYMLNKPAGVVSATEDNTAKTVLDCFPIECRKNLFPVGRLDKDTEGLLLLTNDGELAHNLLSPKKHVDKTYYVKLKEPVSKEQLILLEQGMDIGEKNMTLPAKADQIDINTVELTIHEGKFHQVKRMFQAIHNEVIYLKRIKFGGLDLDPQLPLGGYRELTSQELSILVGNSIYER